MITVRTKTGGVILIPDGAYGMAIEIGLRELWDPPICLMSRSGNEIATVCPKAPGTRFRWTTDLQNVTCVWCLECVRMVAVDRLAGLMTPEAAEKLKEEVRVFFDAEVVRTLKELRQ